MRSEVSRQEICDYQERGFVVIEDFLTDAEVSEWALALDSALRERGNFVLPDRRWENQDGAALKQRVNLSQSSPIVKKLLLKSSLGKLAAMLSGITDGVRLWADQALIKPPFSPPTGYHNDGHSMPFNADRAINVWIAIDRATLENGAMCYVPRTHLLKAKFDTDFHRSVGGIFEAHQDWHSIDPAFCPIRAGGAIFNNMQLVHGACANMTPKPRRAYIINLFPNGERFNGTQNILSDEQFAAMKVGDLLDDDRLNPQLK